jgi:hypothetical protein
VVAQIAIVVVVVHIGFVWYDSYDNWIDGYRVV